MPKELRRQQRRILHISDLHLEVIGDKTCKALELVVDTGIKHQVNIMVSAGDFFDSNRVRDDLVHFAIEQLKRLKVPVLLVPGNHDCLVPDNVYDRVKAWKNAHNVHIFHDPEGETVVLPQLEMSVWGKPICTYDGFFQPLVGVPKPEPEKNSHWYIAVVHGYYMGEKSREWASFHITHEDIIASGQDYVALGDSHGFTCISDEAVKAYYSGSPSYATESVAIVDLIDGSEPRVTRVPLWGSTPTQNVY